jgi:hypothetical protein
MRWLRLSAVLGFSKCDSRVADRLRPACVPLHSLRKCFPSDVQASCLFAALGSGSSFYLPGVFSAGVNGPRAKRPWPTRFSSHRACRNVAQAGLTALIIVPKRHALTIHLLITASLNDAFQVMGTALVQRAALAGAYALLLGSDAQRVSVLHTPKRMRQHVSAAVAWLCHHPCVTAFTFDGSFTPKRGACFLTASAT